MAHFGIIDGRQDPCKARTLTRCYTKKHRKPLSLRCSLSFVQCGRWDLNPHKRNAYKILSLARLPVPTLPHRLVRFILSNCL